jgi:hypothetical protein
MCRHRLGVQDHKIFTLETDGLVWILFKELAARFPSKDSSEKKRILTEFEARLSDMAGGASPHNDYATQAAWRLDRLDTQAFLGVLDWLVDQLNRSYALTLKRRTKS